MTRDIRCRSRWGHRPNVSRISLLKHGRRRTKTVDLGVLDMGSTLLPEQTPRMLPSGIPHRQMISCAPLLPCALPPHAAARIRASSRSIFARPYIDRFTSFSFVICPST